MTQLRLAGGFALSRTDMSRQSTANKSVFSIVRRRNIFALVMARY